MTLKSQEYKDHMQGHEKCVSHITQIKPIHIFIICYISVLLDPQQTNIMSAYTRGDFFNVTFSTISHAIVF